MAPVEKVSPPGTPTATTPTANTPTAPAACTPTSVASIKLDLPVGAVVATPRERYTIIAHLANSGLTKLYLVMNSCRSRRVMRVEYAKIPRIHSRIKTELPLLESLYDVPRENKSHFLQLFDKGRTNIFKFVIVMQMGPTLLQIREKLLEQDDFGEHTALYIACGTFQAIRDLHRLNFVHRDINLARFAVGLGTFEKQIFMYNLKEMKRYMTDRGHIKRLKEEKQFVGSLLFGSRNAMRGGEQSRRDDLESWLYMVFDIYDRQTFSSFFEGRMLSEAILIKQEIMNGKFSKSFFKKIPRVFIKLCGIISNMDWSGEPDYDAIEDILRSAQSSNELRRNEYLDWSGKIEMREDLKDMPERIFNYRKPNSRPDIISNGEWSSKSGESTGDDEMSIPKEPIKRTSETSRNKGGSNRKPVVGRKKNATIRSTMQRKKQSNTKSGKASKRLDDDADGRSATRKGGRRYKGSKSSTPSRERILEQEPSSYTGILPSKESMPSSNSRDSENGSAPKSKEVITTMTAVEKKKLADKLHRQMHVNVTETTEEDAGGFNFVNDKQRPM